MGEAVGGFGAQNRNRTGAVLTARPQAWLNRIRITALSTAIGTGCNAGRRTRSLRYSALVLPLCRFLKRTACPRKISFGKNQGSAAPSHPLAGSYYVEILDRSNRQTRPLSTDLKPAAWRVCHQNRHDRRGFSRANNLGLLSSLVVSKLDSQANRLDRYSVMVRNTANCWLEHIRATR